MSKKSEIKSVDEPEEFAVREKISADESDGENITDQREKEYLKDKEIASLKEQLMRLAAEYDNYRKRAGRERIELEPEIVMKIVLAFLPVLDSIERALSMECADENFRKGVELIYENFLENLKKFNVEEIDSSGTFDPTYHQAVQQIQCDDKESGRIAGVFQKGYKIKDKVIRFAMVSVVS